MWEIAGRPPSLVDPLRLSPIREVLEEADVIRNSKALAITISYENTTQQTGND
jgi:hypothetical protein